MRALILTAVLAVVTGIFSGCQGATDSGTHLGYSGSLPGKCTSCE